jgi:hypothetical protein
MYATHLEYHMGYNLIIWGEKEFIQEEKCEKVQISCHYVGFLFVNVAFGIPLDMLESG